MNHPHKRMKTSRTMWKIWIRHEAFGVEGRQSYSGSELGAKRLANRLVRDGGYGWVPVYVRAEVTS